MRKSQGNSPRFAGSTKLRTVSFHVYFTIQCTIFQYFAIFESRNLSRNLFTIYHIYNIVPIYLPFSDLHTPCVYLRFSSELILYIKSPLYLFSSSLMQLNICHTLHSPTYWIFPPDSSQFAGCFSLQSMTIIIYFCLSPNHAIICFTSSVT